MSKLSKSIMGGLLFSFWLMCFVFPISLIMSFSDHTPIGAFLVQQVIDFVRLRMRRAHGVIGMFDEANKPRRDDNDDHRNDHRPNDARRIDKGPGDLPNGNQTNGNQPSGDKNEDGSPK